MGSHASKPDETGGWGVPCKDGEAPVPAGFGRAFRHPLASGGLRDAYPDPTTGSGVTTLFENFQCGLRMNNGRGPCWGWWKRTGEKQWEQNITWISYTAAYAHIINFGSGMIQENLLNAVEDSGKALNVLGLYCKNRWEWTCAEQACNAYKGVVVPLYDTLGRDTIKFVVNQAGLKTVVCGTMKDAQNLLSVAEECPTLKAIVVCEGEKSGLPESPVRVYMFEEVLQIGNQNRKDPIPPHPDDVATFCYTSGTTGDPKGAMLTHRNIMAVMCSAYYAGVRISPADVHLSYLPLPHMFERVIQASCWGGGASVGFFKGETQMIMDDLKALRPTIFPSVPRLFNKVYDKITSGAASAGGLKTKMFNMGLKHKTGNLDKGVNSKVFDKLVFDKLRVKIGLDRCRFMLTGSAPIAQHVMEFLRAALVCPVLEGYGQTECAAAATITGMWDHGTVGHVGGPLICNYVALEGVPDMGWNVEDKEYKGMPIMGAGEVCFKGPNVFPGYFRNPEKTAEAIDSDGWLHSGDIGVWLKEPSGVCKLKIVDRKKNIFKLSQGEYVAPEKLEQAYGKSKLIEQIFVHGDSLHASLVAIIVPDPDGIKELRADATPAWCVEAPEYRAAVLAELKELAKAAKFVSYEIPREITIAKEPFSVENDMMTPTFKLKRNIAQKVYQKDIDEMYQKEQIGGKTGLRQ